MTREEAINEINKVFAPAYANYIVTALTEGATVSDKKQGITYIQAIYTDALEEGIRCAMCTNTIKSDTGCDGGCIVDTKMYNKVMTEINSRLLRKIPREGHWIEHEWEEMREKGYYRCSVCNHGYQRYTKGIRKSDVPYIDGQEYKLWNCDNYCPNCGADMREVYNGNVNN